MKRLQILTAISLLLTLNACQVQEVKTPADYVNPYIGNISHMLVPTYPTVHLPNSMLRVYPEREDYTSELLRGLPVMVPGHRRSSAFSISPCQQRELKPVINYTYDQENIRPYFYEVTLDEEQIRVEFAPSHQSAIYQITYNADQPATLLINSRKGALQVADNMVSGYQCLDNDARVYLYLESESTPQQAGILAEGTPDFNRKDAEGNNACAVLKFAEGTRQVRLRYGISFISVEQARKNMQRELTDYDVKALAEKGKQVWNEALGSLQVEGGTEAEKAVFYTSLYRILERPVCISEDGRYYSGFDKQVHDDNGEPFYTDDWIWDTYRAAHPLRILINPQQETDIIKSYIRMAEQREHMWLPTFPSVVEDAGHMNCNHGTIMMADAMTKGLQFDYEKAYQASRNAVEEKTLIPWSKRTSGWIDEFYNEHGYIPGLATGEEETVEGVNPFERRQSVAVTLGTSYDQWCLSLMAEHIGKQADAAHYKDCAYNYRNLFNPETSFFHPKDKNGKWVEPFDYRFTGGMGAREYYDENNGWTYRWGLPYNVADLIALMGGREKFIQNLDQTFREPLHTIRYKFYSTFPDQTGNVGQFSMANEPSMHIPYLYNYAGQPWKTQKRVRSLLNMWFRNDLMGIPGDEDGGGLTAFAVFSALGFYPVSPGIPAYNIGSPLFEKATVKLGNGKTFTVDAKGASEKNKYVQSATLNGKEWNKPWFSHDDIKNGGTLTLVMGDKPNKDWGSDANAAPPSMDNMR